MPRPPALLRTEEVAEVLRVHPKHVYRLLKRGLPARRVGSEWRFDRAEVLQWARRGGKAPAGGDAPVGVEGRAPPAPEQAADAPPSLVAANGDLVVSVLLRQVHETGLLLGLVQADKETGLRHLEAGRVLATGCHAGGFPTHAGAERVARVHLVTREVGLAVRPGDAAPGPGALAGLRLASRPRSAGVRQYLDEALRAEGIDPEPVHRKAMLMGSHLDVACAVASRRADVGLVSRAWGERLGLSFTPLARESYGLLVRARDLGDPRVVRLCEVAQGERFRAQVGAMAGYDAAGAGEIRYDGAPASRLGHL
jgi:excisionase family DNA binding protein